MNDREKTIYTFLRVVFREIGVEDKEVTGVSKKWLKATTTLLYYASGEGLEIFLDIWRAALRVRPIPLVFDGEYAYKVVGMPELFELVKH